MQIFFCVIITSLGCTILFIVLHRYLLQEYTEYIKDLESENDKAFEFITELQRRSIENYKRITEVDKRGSFRSDDEVGFVFNTLRDAVQDIYTFVNESVRPEKEGKV